MTFSETLKYLREERQITQKQLAYACNLSPQCICNLEQGTRNPTGSTIRTLAVYFGVSADYLLGLEDDFGVKETEKSLRAYDHHEITDKQTYDVLKMYKALNEFQKAKVFGYLLGLLEQSGISAASVLGN